MPTGYTSAVQDGTLTDFPTFALRCARAFGALVMLRDDSMDAPIPEEFKPSTKYHDDTLAEATAKLAELEAMSEQQKRDGAQADYDRAMAFWEGCCRKKRIEEQRYSAMIERVRAWTPPTEEHQGLKDFMLSQLRESIKFDCSPYEMPKRLGASEWWRDQVSNATQDINYHTKARAEEIERTRGRNEWVAALRRSLPS